MVPTMDHDIEPAPADQEPTADDVAARVTALPPQPSQVFELTAAELTRKELIYARTLNDSGPAAHGVRLELIGEIHGLRTAMCFMVGLSTEDADKEGPMDSFMTGRREAQGWAGWPGSDSDPELRVNP